MRSNSALAVGKRSVKRCTNKKVKSVLVIREAANFLKIKFITVMENCAKRSR